MTEKEKFDLMENIRKVIMSKIEADITKKQEKMLEDYKVELEKYKEKAIAETMKNVVIYCSNEHQGMNFTITFRKE